MLDREQIDNWQTARCYATCHGDTLMVYTNGKLVSQIGPDDLPHLLVDIAKALQYRVRVDNADLPLG
jgi:hypothetical protein